MKKIFCHMERKYFKNEIQIKEISLRSKYWYEFLYRLIIPGGTAQLLTYLGIFDSKVSNQFNLSIYTGCALCRSSSYLLHILNVSDAFSMYHFIANASYSGAVYQQWWCFTAAMSDCHPKTMVIFCRLSKIANCVI